jgi:hypothetical protein
MNLISPGLKHAAFALFHEADLDKSNIDPQKVPSKMLIHFLEKSLLFNRVETHLYKVYPLETKFILQNEHVECEESFELLTPHNCKTVELKKQEKSSLLNQYNHEISNVMNEEEPSAGAIQKVKISTDSVHHYYGLSHLLDCQLCCFRETEPCSCLVILKNKWVMLIVERIMITFQYGNMISKQKALRMP